MPIYGILTAETPEQFAKEVAAEKNNAGGIYGPLVIDAIPAEPEAPAVLETAIGTDYTVDTLMAAIKNDPALAEDMAKTELARVQGARKGALQFLALQNLKAGTQASVLAKIDELSAAK